MANQRVRSSLWHSCRLLYGTSYIPKPAEAVIAEKDVQDSLANRKALQQLKIFSMISGKGAYLEEMLNLDAL